MRSNINRLLILILSFALVSFGVSHAGDLFCIPGCPQCKPVVQLSCCESQPSTHQTAVHAGMQENQKLPTECCHSELCRDLFSQMDEIVATAPTTVAWALNASQSSRFETQLVSPPPKLLGPSPILARMVSLYTRNCSLLI